MWDVYHTLITHLTTAKQLHRQLFILLTLIAAGCEDGMRVGEITQKTHLSRPTVSHHLKVLKDARVVNVRRVATMKFYYIDPENNSLKMLKNLLQHMDDYIAEYWEPLNK
jgi:DNA-binding transcriptional ArsR family regulator